MSNNDSKWRSNLGLYYKDRRPVPTELLIGVEPFLFLVGSFITKTKLRKGKIITAMETRIPYLFLKDVNVSVHVVFSFQILRLINF